MLRPVDPTPDPPLASRLCSHPARRECSAAVSMQTSVTLQCRQTAANVVWDNPIFSCLRVNGASLGQGPVRLGSRAGVTLGASRWVHHAGCVTLGASRRVRHAGCVTLGASRWVRHAVRHVVRHVARHVVHRRNQGTGSSCMCCVAL